MSNSLTKITLGLAATGLGLFNSTAAAGYGDKCACKSHTQVIVKHCPTCSCAGHKTGNHCSAGAGCSGLPWSVNQNGTNELSDAPLDPNSSAVPNAATAPNTTADPNLTAEPIVEEAIEGAGSVGPLEPISESATSGPDVALDDVPDAPGQAETENRSPVAAPKSTIPIRDVRYAEPTKDAVPNPPEPKPIDSSDVNIFNLPIVFDGYGEYVRPSEQSARQSGSWQ